MFELESLAYPIKIFKYNPGCIIYGWSNSLVHVRKG